MQNKEEFINDVSKIWADNKDLFPECYLHIYNTSGCVMVVDTIRFLGSEKFNDIEDFELFIQQVKANLLKKENGE